MKQFNVLQQNKIKGMTILWTLTIYWGLTTVLMRNVLVYMDSATYIFLRFALASIILVPFFISRLKQINKRVLLMGAILGICLGLTLELSVFALKFTKVSNSVFLANLTVVFVPIYTFIKNRTKPSRAWLISIIFILPGLFFLGGGVGFSFNFGDFLSVLSTLVVSARLILTDKFVSNEDPFTLGIIQVFFAAFVGLAGWSTSGFPAFQINFESVMILILTGIVGTALAFIGQNYAQKMVLPIHVSMVFSFLPIFGVIGAGVIPDAAGKCEPITANLVLGCMLIIIGMIFYEWFNHYGRKHSNSQLANADNIVKV